MSSLLSRYTNLLFRYRQLMASSLLLLFLATSSMPSMAAYCSLRDPITAIRTLYPDSTQHRSIVKPITILMRQQIAERLPFTIHYKEIGKHTLYLALKSDLPVGIVQARSELSSWGLIEIAWAINTDLTIGGMVFQRCRNPHCTDSLRAEIQTVLNGKSFEEILELITDNGLDLTDKGKVLLPNAGPLHLTIIHSALKTLSVTDLAWQKDILELQSVSNSTPRVKN